jgi:hypothetical protein
MEGQYHREMLARVLGQRVSPRALSAITAGNLGQDGPVGWFRPEFHFDNSLFTTALAYVEENRTRAVRASTAPEAWAAFGRLSHAVQDFYAHSNYCALWLHLRGATANELSLYAWPESPPPPANLPSPSAIDALDPAVLKHPRLRSGNVYYPTELMWAINLLQPLVKRLVPRDSHAWMNLDAPKTGLLFPYAIEAAVTRTQIEFDRTLALIGETQGEAMMRVFLGQRES